MTTNPSPTPSCATLFSTLCAQSAHRGDPQRRFLTPPSIAGRDTTAQALTWLFYNLSINPPAEERLLEEIREMFPEGVAVDFESVKNARFLKACIDETLRCCAVTVAYCHTLSRSLMPLALIDCF